MYKFNCQIQDTFTKIVRQDINNKKIIKEWLLFVCDIVVVVCVICYKKMFSKIQKK